MAYLHQLHRGTSSHYPNGILNETRRHSLEQERIRIKRELRKGDVNQARKQIPEDWNTHLPTPPEEALDCEMNRSPPGKTYSRQTASNVPTSSQMSGYVQQDEIIFSSSSSSSDDEAIGSRASKPLPRQSQDIDKHLEQSRVPSYAVPAHQVGRKTGSFPPNQTGHNTSLKRTANGQNKPQSLEAEKYRSPYTLSQGRPPKQSLIDQEEDESDSESPGQLLRKFQSLVDAKVPERRGLGADDCIPFALQSADTDFHPPGRAVATNREDPTNSLPTDVLSHRSSLSYSTTTASSLALSQVSDPFLSSARSVPKPSYRPPRKENRDDSYSDSDFSSGLKPSNKLLRFPNTHQSPKKFRHHRISSRSDSKDSLHVRSLSPPSQALKERASQFPRPFKLSQPVTSKALKAPHSQTHSRLPGRKLTSPHSSRILRSDLTTLLNRELGNRDRRQIITAAAIQTDSYAALRSTRRWHGASGDIIVVGWSADGLQYAAGAATAMDIQNPQYNKRYNLLAGDLGLNTLRELPDHYQGLRRTTGYSVKHPAPLYTTVSDLKWDVEGAHMYSSSYDWTVKRWDMTGPTGPQCVETFWHENPVEVMAISTVDDSGLLATGTNQSNTLTDTPLSLFNLYDDDNAQNGHHSKTSLPYAGGFKGYTPTVMQWGSINATKEYLVAGLSGKHHKNMEDPPSQGLLCLWNISDDHGVIQKKLMPSSSNVFDAVWHPTKEWLAAGSPINYMSAANYAAGTRSLIRIYDPLRATHKIVEYECPALDMNTISFSSTNANIISASCTDSVTYFWDHRKQSEVLCKLVHGDPLYPTGSPATRELHDTGVRVALWGAGGDSFYTGSSDGVLKQWNIKLAPEDALVRDVQTFPAEVMSGKFSPDFSNLLIGDAAGGIHTLSADPNNSGEEDLLPGEIVFERAALSTSNDDGLGALAQKVDETARPAAAAAQELIRSGQIVVDPVFGPGQGPRYAGPYAGYAHTDGDPANTLIPEVRALQLDERQSRGFESLLDEESTRRKRANQGLARARNGGASRAGAVSGVGEKRARIVHLENDTSAEEDAGTSRRKKAAQPFEYVASDNSDKESVMIKEEEGVRFAPSAGSSATWFAVPGSAQRKGVFIDLTLDD